MTWDGGEPVLGSIFSEKMVEEFGKTPQPTVGDSAEGHGLGGLCASGAGGELFRACSILSRSRLAKSAVCLAGGVALNCVANGMIFERTNFRDVYVQPAAHDAGTSIGAALYVQHQELNLPRCFEMRHVYYGSEYTDGEILHDLEGAGMQLPRTQ